MWKLMSQNQIAVGMGSQVCERVAKGGKYVATRM